MVALRMTTAKRSQINSPSTQITTVSDEPIMLTTARRPAPPASRAAW